MPQERLGEINSNSVEIYKSVAKLYEKLEDDENFLKAIYYYEKALDTQKRLGVIDLDTIEIYNSIGKLYERLIGYERAKYFYQKATDTEKKLKEISSNTIEAYNKIAKTYKESGEYKKALEYYKKALDIRKKVFEGEEVNTLIKSYNNLKLDNKIFKNMSNQLNCYTRIAKNHINIIRSIISEINPLNRFR